MPPLSLAESVKEAESAIQADNLPRAASIYEKIVTRQPHNEHGYNRLMMIYRKQGAFNKELQIINSAIRNVTSAYQSKGQKLYGNNSAVKNISNELMKSLGLKTASGKYLLELPIVESWKKRKEIVLKKINKVNRKS
ncbi:hypothetical protein BH10BAC2_BH10BAC2_35390 [soil metagenome]